MKEPEISTRITELKNEFQEETDKKLAQFDKHGEKLMSLESEFGFDLDVATDIYGDALLDPTDSEKVVEQWATLLEAIKENPERPLVLIREVTVPTGYHSVSPVPGIKYSYRSAEIALIPSVSLDSFSYHPADGEQQAYIAVEGKDIKLAPPYSQRKTERGFIHAPENEDSVIIATRKDLVTLYRSENMCITDSDCHILYNPTWQEARGLVDSIVDESFPFPVRFFNPLRHSQKANVEKA